MTVWKETRDDHLALAQGILQLTAIDKPTRKQLGAAAVIGEFLVAAVHFLNPKVK